MVIYTHADFFLRKIFKILRGARFIHEQTDGH